jgi:hypothetical protein
LKISVSNIDGEKAQSASQNKRISIVTVDEYAKPLLDEYTKQFDEYVKEFVGPAGGFLFYDKGAYTDGWRYLEAAPEYRTNIDWGEVKLDGLETSIGSGKRNTQRILDEEDKQGFTNDKRGSAARLCRIVTSRVYYYDWFLPSKDELDLLYKKNKDRKAKLDLLHKKTENLKAKLKLLDRNTYVVGVDDFKDGYNLFAPPDIVFWSSSQHGTDGPWYQDFSDGRQLWGIQNGPYNNNRKAWCVRAIRAF